MAMDFSRKPPGFNTVTKKREYEDLAKALLERAEQTCRYLLPMGRREVNEWKVGSIDGERGKSMSINLKKGVWTDFADQPGGADLLALWADKRGVKMHVAYDEAAAWLGWDTGKPKADTPAWVAPVKPVELPPPIEKDEGDLWWINVESKKWEYFDENGELWVTVRRWDNPKGGKRVRPWDPKEQDEKWPEGLRPLFNLQGIKTSPDPVLLVEGEKCADALIALGITATTCAGGSSATRVADWTPLKGRDVVRWADNDAAGAKWATETRTELEKAGVRSIRDVAIPAGKPEGWDCADATDGEVKALIEGAGDGRKEHVIACAPATLPSFADIPKRRFIYDTVYQRGFVSITAGEGGSGKSAMHVIEALCIATGRDLHELGKKIERCRVWMISLEDDLTEMYRRLAAAMMHFGIDRSEIDGWLFLTTKDDAPDFLLAASDRDGVQISQEAISDLKEEIAKNDIGVVMIDPYVFLHTINENDNMGQGAVMKALANVAGQTNAAIAVVHHSKKPSANDRSGPSSSDMRGASSIVNASRHGRLVIVMSASDADKFGVPAEQRFYYFHTASVKTSYTPPGHHSKWFKLHSVTLPNGNADEEGDGVGVVTRWQPPDPFKVMGMTVDTLRAVQAEFGRAYKAGTPYRANSKAVPWAGEVIGNEVGLEPKDVSDKRKIAKILKTWIENGVLVEDMWNDGHQKRPIIRPGP
jgi:hypothetical protein